MARNTKTVTKEVLEIVISCDICGSSVNVSRYAENRVCHHCGREVCNHCIADQEFFVECKICTALSAEWTPKINAAYQELDSLKAQYKAASLAVERT